MSGSPDEVLQIAESIKPLLAGKPAEIQGAVLAELLSLWLAGHYQGDHPLTETLLMEHISVVRQLVPLNVNLLRARAR